MRTKRSKILVLLSAAFAIACPVASAVSPATIAQGRQLFERNWPVGNPIVGSDGLGPLFNGQSCVACHHQGGVGGGGDSKFNAKTIGIENLRITGAVDNSVIAKMVGTFHPGFVQTDGSVINTLTIPHHGGSPAFRQINAKFLSNVPGEFSESGGPESPVDVRQSYASPVLFNRKIGNNEIFIRARLYQRNTTPLFGAGLIDAVDMKDLKAQITAQKSHPEISGRPATLNNGRIGKFGWRGNVASLVEFVDQACANEVGLETKRKPQGRDPMNLAYRNPAIDISDDQIRAMAGFIAALPAPVREIPSDPEERMIIARGERAFASVGCAICHVPNLGPARGLYSDLLLHEMGSENIDLNHAEPYVIRRTPVQRVTFTRATTTERSAGSMGAYYGATTTIQSTDPTAASRSLGRGTRRNSRIRTVSRSGYKFIAPDYPNRLMNIVDIDSESMTSTKRSTDEAGALSIQQESLSKETYIRIHYEKTKFNEEWRTPPLWGLRDSAPYMHDGRAETVLESIAMHDGEAAGTRDRFLQLSLADRHAVLAFLQSMVAPPNVPQPSL